MCVLLHLLICTAVRAHIIIVEELYKINYYYRYSKTKQNKSSVVKEAENETTHQGMRGLGVGGGVGRGQASRE